MDRSDVFFAPGRLNIIGEHTDYTGGYVMPAPLSVGVKIHLLGTAEEWYLSSMTTDELYRGLPDAEWSGSPALGAFVKAIAQSLQDSDLSFSPVKAVIAGDLPPGCGLSSSTALVSALLAAMNARFQWHLSRTELMWLSQSAEQNTGIECGIMDQFCLWRAHAGKALMLDCENLTASSLDIHLPGWEWYILLSGVQHRLTDTPYNLRRRQLSEGIADLERILGRKPNLKSPDRETWQALEKLSDTVRQKRVRHLLTENARVLQMQQALTGRDACAAATLLNEGHQSLVHDFDLSCPEIDLLRDIFVKNCPEGGIRMVGGGFGGAMVALVPAVHATQQLARVLLEYRNQTGLDVGLLKVCLDGPVRALRTAIV